MLVQYNKTTRVATDVPILDDTDYLIRSQITTPSPSQPKIYNKVGVIVPKKSSGGLDATAWTLVTQISYGQYTDLQLDFYDSVYLINSVDDQATLDTALSLASEFVQTIVPCSESLVALNYDAFKYVVIKYASEVSDEMSDFVKRKYNCCFYANSHNEGLWCVTNFLRYDGSYPNLFTVKGKEGYTGTADPSFAESLNNLGYSNYMITKQGASVDYFNVATYTAHVAYGSAYLNFNIKKILVDITGRSYSDSTAVFGKSSIQAFLESVKSQDNSFISERVTTSGKVIDSYKVTYNKLLQDTGSKQEGKIVYNVEVLFVGHIHRITLELTSLF